MSEVTTKYDDVLDQQTLNLLGESPAESSVVPESLRARVMQQVDKDIASTRKSFLTVRDGDGQWIEIAPKLKKKVLFLDKNTGAEAYLLKGEPGAEAPPHVHEFDEHCLVLEGEMMFEDLHLRAGDYHFAAAGSEHGVARTDVGVLVYIQTGQPGGAALF